MQKFNFGDLACILRYLGHQPLSSFYCDHTMTALLSIHKHRARSVSLLANLLKSALKDGRKYFKVVPRVEILCTVNSSASYSCLTTFALCVLMFPIPHSTQEFRKVSRSEEQKVNLSTLNLPFMLLIFIINSPFIPNRCP